MALLHADPFAHYSSAQIGRVYSTLIGSAIDVGPYGRSGAPGLRFSDDLGDGVELALTPSDTTAIAQFDIRISAYEASGPNVLWGWMDGATFQCVLNLETDGTLRAYRSYPGFGDPIGSASTYVVPLDEWIHVEVKTVIGNSGSFIVHVWEDGDAAAQVVLNHTSVDTQNTANVQWTGFHMGAVTSSGNTDYANLVVMDGAGSAANDFLGPADVWALWANAREASALTDWSLSTGSDAAALTDDATADDDTTYLAETTQNQQMTVAVDAVPYPGREILGAQLYAAVKLTSGSPSLRGIGYESASANLGVTFAPTASYTYLMGPYSAMPSGAAFATAAAFDALQWGLKLTTTSTGARVTQIVVALIQRRDAGKRNLLVGYSHTVGGDDNVASGRSNAVTGSSSQAHGSDGSVIGDQSVLFNLDGTPRSLVGNGKFEVYGDVGGDIARSDRTYLTEDDETATLPNSRQLLPGTSITFDDSVPGERTINASGGGGNAFGKIVVSGQSDVDADASADTLTLVAGTGIAVTTNAGTDTVTITATGAGGSWELVQEQTPTGTGVVTFSSLGAYTHLRLLWSARGTQAAASTVVDLQVNGDTSAVYDRQSLVAGSASVAATDFMSQTSVTPVATVAAASAAAGFNGVGEIVIFDYRGTAFFKRGTSNYTWQVATGAGNSALATVGFGWRSTSAITSVSLILASGNWDTGSKFSLYGIL